MADIGKAQQQAYDDGYAAGQRDRWISVDDALPEYSILHTGYVLAYHIDEIIIVHYDDNIDEPEDRFGYWCGHYDPETLGWVCEDWKPIHGITHWMPLPKPPEVKE